VLNLLGDCFVRTDPVKVLGALKINNLVF